MKRKLVRMSVVDAMQVCRRDCDFCHYYIARARMMKRDVMVDMKSWDAMKVARPLKK